MVRLLIAALAAITLSACTTVNHVPLSQDASLQLREKTIALTEYPAPDFTAFTAGKAAFAILGAAGMISEGNSIVKENEIQDPAIAIARGLSDKLIAMRNVTVVPSKNKTTGDDIDGLITAYPGANYLLDVKTFNWMFVYYPSDWSHYKVIYNARLRLIDTASKKVVAETMCKSTQADDKNPPTKDQLLDNKAALLKEYLDKATKDCVAVLSKDILQL